MRVGNLGFFTGAEKIWDIFPELYAPPGGT